MVAVAATTCIGLGRVACLRALPRPMSKMPPEGSFEGLSLSSVEGLAQRARRSTLSGHEGGRDQRSGGQRSGGKGGFRVAGKRGDGARGGERGAMGRPAARRAVEAPMRAASVAKARTVASAAGWPAKQCWRHSFQWRQQWRERAQRAPEAESRKVIDARSKQCTCRSMRRFQAVPAWLRRSLPMRWAFAMQISLRGSSRNFRLMRVGKTTSISRRRLFLKWPTRKSKKPWQASEQNENPGQAPCPL